MLKSKDIKYLRSQANGLSSLFQVGKDGLTKNVIEAVNNALEAQELIKINVLKTAEDEVRAIAYDIASATNAEIVQIIGRVIVFYRKSKKELYQF